MLELKTRVEIYSKARLLPVSSQWILSSVMFAVDNQNIFQTNFSVHGLTGRNNDQSCYNLQPGHYSSLPAPNFQSTATQERDDQYGNQHYSRELLMMGIVVPETC